MEARWVKEVAQNVMKPSGDYWWRIIEVEKEGHPLVAGKVNKKINWCVHEAFMVLLADMDMTDNDEENNLANHFNMNTKGQKDFEAKVKQTVLSLIKKKGGIGSSRILGNKKMTQKNQKKASSRKKSKKKKTKKSKSARRGKKSKRKMKSKRR